MSTTPKASLKPHLSEIRAWVAQGRTDIWIAHTLNSTPGSISAFRSEHGILRRNLPGEGRGTAIPPPVIPPDATIEEPPARPKRRRRRGGAKAPAVAEAAASSAAASEAAAAPAEQPAEPAPKRRRRGGRGRRRAAHTFEATLDAGAEGFGFWLDGAVRDDSVWKEHWSGRRALVVKVEGDQLVVRPDERADAGADAGS